MFCIALWRNAGPERFDEAVEYTEQHRLYEAALAIWKGTEHHAVCSHFFFAADDMADGPFQDVLSSYGDWLFERREFRQAATGGFTG